MKKLVPYPDIDQFRNVIKQVVLKAQFTGLDADGAPMYDESAPLPVVRFNGTVKLHGSNGGVSYNQVDGMWVQSRERIITTEDDNFGFARFVEDKKEAFKQMFNDYAALHEVDLKEYTLTLFGEWSGRGINSGTAINQLEKAFYVFGLRLSKPEDLEFVSLWLDYKDLVLPEGVRRVSDYGEYAIDIDFSRPHEAAEDLEAYTHNIEVECPVGKHYGVVGTGEGVVWIGEYGGRHLYFKVKGEKHKISKTKETVPIDPEKLASIEEFVSYAVTENRFDQAVRETVGSVKQADVTKTGDVIRWMMKDIEKEESDVLAENGLTIKDVNKAVAFKTRQMYAAIV